MSTDAERPTEPHSASLMERLASGLLSARYWLLGIAVVATVAAYPLAQRLRFDQSIESLYSADDPIFAAYRQSKQTFGGDEFAIVAWEMTGLFEEDRARLTDESERAIQTFVEQLNEVPGVQTKSTQDLASALAFPYRRDDVKQMLEGVLVSDTDDVTAIVLRLLPEEKSSVSRGETIAKIRELALAHEPRAFVVGEPIQIHDMFRYVEEDGTTLFRASLLVLAVVLFLLFRSLRWVLMPIAIVLVSILWTRAVLVLSQLELSMVSSMLNSLLTIVGIATVMHAAIHFREQRRTKPPIEAARQMLIDLLPAIVWTGLTTAVGFAALMSSDITPVRSFGLMMTLGIAMVLLAVVMLLPGLMLIGRVDVTPRATPGEGIVIAALGFAGRMTKRFPITLLVLFAGLIVFGGLGLTRLRIETDFSKNFRSESELVRSLNFVEERLGGAGTWEVNFPAPNPLTEEYLSKVETLAERLRQVAPPEGEGEALTKVVALPDGVGLVPDRVLFKRFSLSEKLIALGRFQPEFVPSLYAPEDNRMRIVLRARERQTSQRKLWLIEEVRSIAREAFPDAEVSGSKMNEAPQVSGIFLLLAYLIENLLRDQWVSMSLAAVGIVVMMSLAFRSVLLGVLSLLPNLFPIVAVIGVMGWLDVPVNIASAMIASVSIGLTVDSTIHYLFAYRRHRRDGDDLEAALEHTQRDIGRALLFANVALVLGFSVLTLSQFIPLVYFGVLVSVAMIGGVIGNLFLLPLMIRTLARFDSKPEAMTDESG